MGWNASADWELTFKDEDALKACALEFGLDPEGDNKDPRRAIEDMLFDFHEDADFFWLDKENKLTIVGWGGGKAYIIEGHYKVIADHAEGKADWHSDEEDNQNWRVRFKDGTYTEYAGKIVYPGDPDE